MKQRKSKQVRLLSGMLIGIVMIAVLARIVYLNHCYPSPKVITYTENDTIKLSRPDGSRVDKMKLYMVLQYYPQKIRLCCTG